jgi:hypothetical protein
MNKQKLPAWLKALLALPVELCRLCKRAMIASAEMQYQGETLKCCHGESILDGFYTFPGPLTELEIIQPKQKPISRPLAYVFLLPNIIKAAREHGYAITLHGSLQRDFDLVAIPWTDNASDPDALVAAIREAAGATMFEEWEDKAHHNPTIKPHGRLAWNNILGGDYYIDLSVMPRLESCPPLPLGPFDWTKNNNEIGTEDFYQT